MPPLDFLFDANRFFRPAPLLGPRPGTFLQRIQAEVEAGLSSGITKFRMDRARKARDFYNHDGEQHMTEFLNDAETSVDYVARRYRESGFAREAVDVLSEHLYDPGPARTFEGAEVDAVLKRVYEDNHINALMQRAESIATLMDCAAIQIEADREYDDHPIKLRLWGADEFEIWEDPNDRLEPIAVCTRDRYDLESRFRLWTAERVYTYLTDKADGTAGGRVARLVDDEENPYGALPFEFVHYSLPVNDFWEPGVGGLIVSAEIRINDRLSRLDQAIHKHLYPIPIAKNAPDGFQVVLGQPNMFVRLNRRAMAPGADGAFGGGAPPEPELSYLQADIDVEGAWRDMEAFGNQVLEAARVPKSAVRMEQTGVSSGIALIVEQAPLLTRARRRQPAFGIYEEKLGRRIAICVGNYFHRPALVIQAHMGRMLLAWPQPTTPVQTDDWLNLQMMRLEAGLTSKIQITMETYGCSREQAVAILEQVEEDREEMERIRPDEALKAEANRAQLEASRDGAAAEGNGQPPPREEEGPA